MPELGGRRERARGVDHEHHQRVQLGRPAAPSGAIQCLPHEHVVNHRPARSFASEAPARGPVGSRLCPKRSTRPLNGGNSTTRRPTPFAPTAESAGEARRRRGHKTIEIQSLERMDPCWRGVDRLYKHRGDRKALIPH